jgi:hypothetical protein
MNAGILCWAVCAADMASVDPCGIVDDCTFLVQPRVFRLEQGDRLVAYALDVPRRPSPTGYSLMCEAFEVGAGRLLPSLRTTVVVYHVSASTE